MASAKSTVGFLARSTMGMPAAGTMIGENATDFAPTRTALEEINSTTISTWVGLASAANAKMDIGWTWKAEVLADS